MRFLRKTLGSIPGPHDAYATIIGIRTLALRMDRHCENAHKVAEFLSSHPQVERVYYPGLPSHPEHETARRQMKGYGGVVSFEVAGDYRKFAQAVASQGLIYLAESLGSVESLLAHPATMSHAYLTEERRKAAGIKDNLFRLSVGIENVEDIISSLDRAMAAAK